VASGLETGFLLDRQWYWMRGEMEKTKKPALLAVCRVLNESRTSYAIIGGVALQVHHPDPRTTIDIDIAVLDRAAIPRAALTAAGFSQTGSFEHSDNWTAPDGTAIQFTDDHALAAAIASADVTPLDGVTLRVMRMLDLLHEKIRSGTDPARRRTKRIQDLLDAQTLIDAKPDLATHLSDEERAALDRLPK
jgi:hypothetical protein